MVSLSNHVIDFNGYFLRKANDTYESIRFRQSLRRRRQFIDADPCFRHLDRHFRFFKRTEKEKTAGAETGEDEYAGSGDPSFPGACRASRNHDAN